MNNGYALIKNGVVEQVVVWDGQGDLFSDFTTYALPDGAIAGPGYIASEKDGYYEFSAPVIVKSSAQIAAEKKLIANSEYDRASSKITALQQQIDDEDYSTPDVEASLKNNKALWTNYRKSLRAYINDSDGSYPLPSEPVI